jgi:glucokinase
VKNFLIGVDLGGSTYRTRVVDQHGNTFGSDEIVENPGRKYSSLQEALSKTIQNLGTQPKRVVVAAAGPPDGKRVKATNIEGWPEFDGARIEDDFLTEVVVVNDMIALARGTNSVPLVHHLRVPQRQDGKVTVLAISTGAGAAQMDLDSRGAIVDITFEDGHRDFAPKTQMEWAYVNWLKVVQGEEISYEMVASCGHGFFNALSFLTGCARPEEKFAELGDYETKDYGKFITPRALAGDDLCVRATQLVGHMIGRFLANETVGMMPLGGVRIVSPLFKDPKLVEFLVARTDLGKYVGAIGKSNHRDQIRDIGIALIPSGNVGLRGAIEYGLSLPTDGLALARGLVFS